MPDDGRTASGSTTGERLVSIETKLDALVLNTTKIGDDHERRIRRLEGWMYALPVTALTAATGVAIAIMRH